ncbi:metalloregulator ArsR/SmtB family transcription factor [Patescibacteria group bacterium]|nr:metalloregulator ArsR/SmtB family transcription factor [Patescibacteria group bacterium]MBU0964204.1 metalloregulator ArsR/SmtB family transcription factor [Patescibacteria group bacterium]
MPKPCCTKNSQKSKEIDSITEFIHILDEPNRLRILCLLKQGERCVCDIFGSLSLSQNLVSHHLKVLRDAQLIDYKKEGTRVIYFRNENVIAKFSELLNNIVTL